MARVGLQRHRGKKKRFVSGFPNYGLQVYAARQVMHKTLNKNQLQVYVQNKENRNSYYVKKCV
jgi:hypothetical protein